MREAEFRTYLEEAEDISSKSKAVNSRVSRANIAETILGISLDSVVVDDDEMYEALIRIHGDSREKNGNIQNAVRWYYQFVNGKAFPRLASYRLRKK